MGEYAIRNSDGQEIKIGTCENMYYLRYSDRDKVRAMKGNVDPMDESESKELRYRLPFPDEDNVRPGEYKDYNRGALLCAFSDPETAEYPGIVQIVSKAGMMCNVTCYHGEKLPENTKDVKFFWNGKNSCFELNHLKFIDGTVHGIYTCTECGASFREPLEKLIPFMTRFEDVALRNRLIEWYCPEMFNKPKVL
jgi:hypothetical protein